MSKSNMYLFPRKDFRLEWRLLPFSINPLHKKYSNLFNFLYLFPYFILFFLSKIVDITFGPIQQCFEL